MNGCSGGNPIAVIEKCAKDGMPTIANYPFRGVNGTCKSHRPIYKCRKPSGACPRGNEAQIETMLRTYGPGIVREFS